MSDQDFDTQSAVKDLELITRVAEQRRREAQPVFDRKYPDWLLDVAQSEVRYTIRHRYMPLTQVSFPDFKNLLYAHYNVKFKKPDLVPFHDKIPGVLGMTEDDLGSLVLRSRNPLLGFEEGRFHVSRDDFIIIKSITITEESIYVVVSGVSQVAELVAKEVGEFIWASTGVQKRWEDIEKGVDLVGYGTGTIVDFGFSSSEFLSDSFRSFVREQVLGGAHFASSMRSYSPKLGVNAGNRVQSIYTLEKLDLLFHHFDSLSGRTESTTFFLSPTDRSSKGSGVLLVASELPFDKHIDCVGSMIERMRGQVGAAKG